MKLKATRVPGLPRLAWLATVRRDDPLVTVLHGETVEIVGDSFIACAWDGPFSEFGMFEATTVMGSGGHASSDVVSLCNGSHPFTELCSVRVGNELHIANSMSLLLAYTDDGPDLMYRYYHRDRVAAWKAGIVASPYRVPTRRDRDVLGYFGVDFEVGTDLEVVTKPKAVPGLPGAFSEYRATLAATVRRVVENATDTARRHPLRAITTLSTGFDSVASSVLGSEAGVRDAITFTMRGDHGDSGTPMGKVLGLNVVEYDNNAWRQLSSTPEIEFSASASGTSSVPFAVFDDGWNNSLVLAGGLGDEVWDIGPGDWGDGFAQPNAGTWSMQGAQEYSLRAGVLMFFVPTVGAVHFKEIEAISTSDEMRPWRLDVEYDRPIPRRIIEEAGVPRGSFAVTKRASTAVFKDQLLGPETLADFTQFWRDALARQSFVRRLRYRAELAATLPVTNLIGGVLLKLNRYLGTRKRIRMWVRHQSLPDAFRFHWAVTRLRDRYAAVLQHLDPGNAPPDSRPEGPADSL